MSTLEPIAICGIGLRLPGGINTPTSLYNFLVDRKDARSQPDKPRYGSNPNHFAACETSEFLATEEGYWLMQDDVTKFDPSMFSMNPRELSKLDPQQRLLLQVVWEALESAAETDWQGQKIGCYVGSFGDDWREMHAIDTKDDGMYRLTGYMDFVQANRISHAFDLRGPSMTIRTACSAAGLAVHLACQAIRAGECDSAVVAGSNLMLSPGFTKLMAEQSVLSPDTSCKTFDANANGYARAEAVNCLFIKNLNSAIRDGNPIRAVIRGSATNSDGKTLGLTTPSAQAQEQLIRDAYFQAGISESDMQQTAMIECHGTGTAVGDTVEACTVGSLFGERGIFIGSVKPNLGHSEAASAITSIIKAVVSLETRTIIPNIKFESPSVRIPFSSTGLKVPTEALPWPENRAERIGINSFGIGGTNVHIIIDSAASAARPTVVRGPKNVDTPPPSPPLRKESITLLLLSAANTESLEMMVQKYHKFIHNHPLKLEALAHTLMHCRSHLAYRRFAIVTNECNDPVVNFSPAPGFQSNTQSGGTAFIFTGQGAQWARMGFHLMKASKEFLQDIREMDAALKDLPKAHRPGWEISLEMMKPNTASRLGEAEFAQPVCTALQVALVRHLSRYGVTPQAVVGHSSGEIAAAYAAGVLTMKEAIIVAYYRGYTAKKMGKLGAMAAVGLGRDQVIKFLTDKVNVACENSMCSVTLSGDVDALEVVCDAIKLAKPDTMIRVLEVDRAYHSHHMKSTGAEYESLLRPYLKPKRPRVTFYSSVTSQIIPNGSDFGPKYWQRNLESPVLFSQTVTSLLQTSSAVFHLEIGPNSTLAGPLKQIYSENSIYPSYVSVQKRGSNSLASFLAAVGELHCRGYSIDFPVLDGVRPLTDLPPYPWNLSKTYWPDSRITKRWQFPEHPPHELLGSPVLENSDTKLSWRCLFSVDKVPWMRDHCVGSDIVFPAAGYIAMAGEVVLQLSEYRGLTIRNMHVMNALVILPGQTIELFTSVRREQLTYTEVSDWWELTIQSSSSGKGWTTHFTCSIKSGSFSKDLRLYSRERHSFLRVTNPSRWYKAMSKVGYNYGPQFRGMQAIRSSITSPAVEVEVPVQTINAAITQSYALHPITIDQVLQSLVIANSSGEPRLLDKLYLPTHAEEIFIGPNASSGSLLVQTLKTGGKNHLQGDSIGVVSGNSSGQAVLFMKGLKFSAIHLADCTEAKLSTRKMAKVVWEPDIDHLDSKQLIQPASTPDFPEIQMLLEKLFVFSGAVALQKVSELDVLSNAKDAHLRRHYHTLKRHIAESKNDWSDLTQIELQHKIKDISLKLERTPASAVAMLIRHCYIHAQALFTSNMNPLELFMKDNALHDVYDWMNTLFTYEPLVRLLSHKRGRYLRILEIGAGTGGLTARILKHLTDCFDDGEVCGKYVFTDISAGFFPAAKARFKAIPEGFLDYRVLDISHDPSKQGFDGEQYDLIVASNVLHATPDLTKTLEHVRALLKPEGRLLMHELCCETKWINFIMGYLSGWWLGETDGRPEEPYISPKQWEERFAAAGFSKPDVFYDAEQRYRLNATLVVRPVSLVPKIAAALNNVTLVCEKDSHPLVITFRDLLRNQGYSVTCTTLCSHGIQLRGAVVSLVDICRGDGYFHDMTQSKLDTFKRLLQSLQENHMGLIWITRPCQIGPVDPTYAPLLGVARTVRAEMGLPFATLEVDSVNPDALLAISRVLCSAILRHDVSTSRNDGDMELCYCSGRIIIPRFRWVPISRGLQSKTLPSLVKMLHISRPGSLQSIRWISRCLSEHVASDHVQIKVQAAGLNFKDVLTAMGLINPSSSEGLGCEASGIVTLTGSSVTSLREGDRVMVFAPQAACFSTDIQAPAKLCVRIPDNLSFADAAAMPCIFVTVLRAIVDKAGLRIGQSILIHSAAGGVGIAAIQIAQWIGATVFATVGNDEKADFISKAWNVPRGNIFSSRDASFVERVKTATSGCGVDVVLNSLSGELLHASWDCVAPHGTFIELGKRDMLAGGKLAMAGFDENRSFIGVEMANLAVMDPDIISRLLNMCVELYEKGHVTPIRPIQSFSCKAAENAFKYLFKGTHIGKVVIDFGGAAADALEVAQPTPIPTFCHRSTYLLVGGMGGLGASIARWMACHGAKSFIFLSRSAGNGTDDQDLLEDLHGRGCEIEAVSCNIEDETKLEAIISKLSSKKRIRGVLNLAMVLSDAALPDLTLDQWQTATSPKIRGTWNLHRLLPSDLDFFVLFGSTSGIHGYPGQANYAAANTFLDTFAQYRRRLGLSCSVLDLGAVEDVGYVSRTQEVGDAIRKTGAKLVSEADMLRGLHLAMAQSPRSDEGLEANTASPEFDGQVLIGLDCDVPLSDTSNRVVWKEDPRMVLYPDSTKTSLRGGRRPRLSGLSDFLANQRGKAADIDTPASVAYLAQEIARKVLSFLAKEVDDTKVDTSMSPSALGVDSLMTIEIRNWWKHTLGSDISVLQIVSAQSFNHLGQLAANQLKEKALVIERP